MNRARFAFPVALLLATAAAFALAGCRACRPCPKVVCAADVPGYWRVTLTDFEGRPISEYIAEGPVRESCDEVSFRAMQRRIFIPFPLTFRYPLGRPVATTASNIVVVPTHKPRWLCDSGK